MILEVHDIEVGNSHAATIKNIDYDYQAEQWAQDLSSDEIHRPSPRKHRLEQLILTDDVGVRAVWKIHENFDVELVQKSERFIGEWILNSRFTPR